MASVLTSVPSRAGFTKQDTSLTVWPHDIQPCFGARLHHFAAQQITVPHGIYAGELVLDPIPLNPAPPGLPVTPVNGCVDILQLIGPLDATEHQTNGGRLAEKITDWASHALVNDGKSYNKQSRDGIARALPEPWKAPSA